MENIVRGIPDYKEWWTEKDLKKEAKRQQREVKALEPHFKKKVQFSYFLKRVAEAIALSTAMIHHQPKMKEKLYVVLRRDYGFNELIATIATVIVKEKYLPSTTAGGTEKQAA